MIIIYVLTFGGANLMNKVFLSKAGFEKLQKELSNLERVERPKIIEAVSTARAHGDLKENAEYHAAKEKQKLIENRIMELKIKLATADVIDNSGKETDEIRFGATIEVSNKNTGDKMVFTIVGDDEADFLDGKLSLDSPVAKALMGKKLGETVDARVPAGTMKFEILSIKYE